MRNLTKSLTLLVACVCLMTATALAGEVFLNHQGRVLDASGSPEPGPVNMTFTLYSVDAGGSPLWTETHNGIVLTDGLFTVNLGDLTAGGIPSAIFDGTERFLEIEVNGDPPLSPRTRLTAVPSAAFAENIPGLSPGPGNINTGAFSFISGDSNTILSDYSAIVGGEHNVIEVYNFADTTLDTIPGPLRSSSMTAEEAAARHLAFGAFLGGGWFNHAHGAFSGIYGGAFDSAMAAFSAVEAGLFNTVEASGVASTIKGGIQNRVRARYSVIVNGFGNIASSPGVFHIATAIGGGGRNLTDNSYTVIGGGYGNVANGYASHIGGGFQNTASLGYSTVGGGQLNQAIADYSFVGGGNDNLSTGAYAAIGGGVGNGANADFVAITGGDKNMGNTMFASVGGGSSNIANGTGSRIGGGIGNGTTNDINTIAGGENNQASMWGATISGGRNNVANDTFSVVGGGVANFAGNDITTVGGGANNSATGKVSTVGGGTFNSASGDSSAISGGALIAATGAKSFVGGGFGHLASGTYATIGGGQENTANNFHTTVAGGQLNIAGNPHAFVGGGATNSAQGPATVIGGGLVNDISSGSLASSIVGGEGNQITGSFSVIGGGVSNSLTGDFGVIPGGNFNSIVSDFSWAGGSYAQAVDTCSFVWASCCRDLATGLPMPNYSNGTNTFNARAEGGFYFLTGCDSMYAPGVPGVHVPPGGSMWVAGSDRNLKRNLIKVDSDDILQKVESLPIYRWSYKAQDESIQHIGPVAQDFYETFKIGDNETTIGTLDPAGVALAAIKALHTKTQALEAEVAKSRDLQIQLNETNRRVDELAALLSTILADRSAAAGTPDLASLEK